MRNFIQRSLMLTLALSFAVVRLPAQSEPSPTPKAPLIPRAPQMSAWTITYDYKKPKPEPSETTAPATPKFVPEQLTALQVVKTGTTYHLTSTFSTGRTSESWIVGGREVMQMGGNYLWLTAGPRYDDFSKSDFAELSWLDPKFYIGVKKRGTQPVFTFGADNMDRPMTPREKIDFDMGSAASIPLGATPDQIKAIRKKAKQDFKTFRYGDSTSTVQLAIDSQLPVDWDDGKVDRIYQFTAPPTDNLVPPPEVAAEYARWAQQTPK